MALHHATFAGLPALEVELPEPGIAIVGLRGEHDLSTRARLDGALAQAGERRNVLVDLSACTFMDSSVIVAMFVARKKLGERDGRLELVIPPEAATVGRVASITLLAAILPIHATVDAGLASLRSAEHSLRVKDLRVAWAAQRRRPGIIRAQEAVAVEASGAVQPA